MLLAMLRPRPPSLLKPQHTLIEADGPHEWLAAMPGEEHVGRGLRTHVIADELFKQVVAEHTVRLMVVKPALFPNNSSTRSADCTMHRAGLAHHIEGRLNGLIVDIASFF